jgi:hypothetical protein
MRFMATPVIWTFTLDCAFVIPSLWAPGTIRMHNGIPGSGAAG